MLGTATGGWRDMLKTGQAWEPIQNHNPGSPNFHKTSLYKLKHPLQQKFRINRARILFSDFPQLKKITAVTIWFHNMVKFPLWSRRYLGTFWWNNLHQAVHVMVLFPAGSHSMKINAYTFLHKKHLYIYLDIHTTLSLKKKIEGTVIKYLWNNWTMTIFLSSVDNKGMARLLLLQSIPSRDFGYAKFFNQEI